jgi:ABC-type multidrug transport system fused ATPase/permease subunit
MTDRLRSDPAATGAWPAFRLVDRVRYIRLVWLMFARVAVGVCDLLLAAALYVLFLRLQGSFSLSHSWSTPETILATVELTAILVVIRALLDVLSTWFASRQIQSLYQDLLLRLVRGYSEMRWERFVERNRTEHLNHAAHTAREAADFCHRWVELAASTIVVIMIAALLYKSPIAAAALGVSLLLFYALHRSLIGARLQRAAITREQTMRNPQRDIAGMLSSGKEIRTYRNHDVFFDRVRKQSEKLSDSNLRIVILLKLHEF